MRQKPSIDSIKKCKKASRTLSLRETDDAVGVRWNCCSTFLSKSGLLAQGEQGNTESDSRNAVVTFRDPRTAMVKGCDSGFDYTFVEVFMILVCGIIP